MRRLEWHPVASRDLLSIDWRLAARVDAAVMEFAETGKGDIERIGSDPRKIRLRVSGAVALLYVGVEELFVTRVFPVSR